MRLALRGVTAKTPTLGSYKQLRAYDTSLSVGTACEKTAVP